MAKVKLTKGELKRQKDDLKRFKRYLPTLVLKKQQLQLEILKITAQKEELDKQLETLKTSVYKWVDVFGEDVNMNSLIKLRAIQTSTGNIAGIDIPVFEKTDFEMSGYDMLITPLWVDYGIDAVGHIINLKARIDILDEQVRLVQEELRVTTQRVNLFEKIKIPTARENIRKINIFLGDMQTAAVVTGKVAKRKIQRQIVEPAGI